MSPLRREIRACGPDCACAKRTPRPAAKAAMVRKARRRRIKLFDCGAIGNSSLERRATGGQGTAGRNVSCFRETRRPRPRTSNNLHACQVSPPPPEEKREEVSAYIR